MNIMVPNPTSLESDLRGHVGRHVAKVFDWDAFPSNSGFPELERAQMRYIGAGGSPKVGDSSTLKPEHFTVSLIHQPVGKYAACHAHEIEESFLILDGVLTVGWERDGEVVEVRLGPKDMILNARDVGHGFRNEGIEPVLMSISVDVGKPLPPRYLYHPKNTAPELARSFGAAPGKTMPFDLAGTHPLQQQMTHYVIRHNEQPTQWDPAGFTRKVYVGPGGVESDTCRKEMLGIPVGVGVKPYERDVEDAFLVVEGSLTVGWEENGVKTELELGPRDLVLNPAGRRHWFRNNSAGPCTVWSVIGTEKPETVAFERA
ncbi:MULTISPECIES: cupin domain-containing protein [unclassified Beijerinckia]|uniref:cupin domain-containing protein n=1 Tax=unclassified Beijerinckia TaxID=2638183 RepID=UPI0008978216|nr:MULTISPECIES: cupin domain-containing protein [unclassified Beijerinckia]MDH7795014.1 mannose-6-phosphate isomerase-like protein (cupin superfamily) [Beijerinckia sp. GAS462]SEB84132.1 Cupin domain-containing protein [Beijerinckia sp. 28-YEA-48]